MKKERYLLKHLVETDVFADSGNFIIGITDDQSNIPFPNVFI